MSAIFVQFLQVEQGVLVLGVEPQHLVERLERAIHEAAALVVEAEAQQHVSVFELAQGRPLQQVLVQGDRLADLSFFSIQIAEDHVDLERIAIEARRLAQLFYREVDLVRHQEVEAKDVMGRLARAAPIDPAAVAQLVALPRLANRQAGEHRHQRGKKQGVRAHRRWPSGAVR
jgi:hypothetical protein